jgi:hypothetical protein
MSSKGSLGILAAATLLSCVATGAWACEMCDREEAECLRGGGSAEYCDLGRSHQEDAELPAIPWPEELPMPIPTPPNPSGTGNAPSWDPHPIRQMDKTEPV